MEQIKCEMNGSKIAGRRELSSGGISDFTHDPAKVQKHTDIFQWNTKLPNVRKKFYNQSHRNHNRLPSIRQFSFVIEFKHWNATKGLSTFRKVPAEKKKNDSSFITIGRQSFALHWPHLSHFDVDVDFFVVNGSDWTREIEANISERVKLRKKRKKHERVHCVRIGKCQKCCRINTAALTPVPPLLGRVCMRRTHKQQRQKIEFRPKCLRYFRHSTWNA